MTTPGDHATIPPLPPRPRRSPGTSVAITAAAVVIALAVGFGLGRATASDGSGETSAKTVRIGTTEAGAPYWAPLRKLAKQEGITIETVSFSDYTQANPALAQGQIDLNLFQHLQFLAAYNSSDNQDLTPIGSTVVVPLPLYSKKHASLKHIPEGGKIAIPNDETNQSRALLVLQQAGLLKLKGGGSVTSTPADIVKATSKVSVVPVDAAQTVPALKSVDGAIVNNNFALDAELDPTDALYEDDPKSKAAEPYINAFVAPAEEKDNPTYRKIVELYHRPQVTKQVERQSKGTSVVVDRPVRDLTTILDRLERAGASS